MSEIEDRRQRAREAGLDATCGMWDAEDLSNGLEHAIETATRVQITDQMIDELADVAFAGGFETRRALVRAAFTLAGFEVIE